MAVDMIRRIAAFMVTLALMFGPGVNGAYAAAMDATMASVANGDTHSGGACGECGTAKAGISVSSCLGACSGFTAVSPESNVLVEASANGSFATGDACHISGRADAPEPYPPRTTDLN